MNRIGRFFSLGALGLLLALTLVLPGAVAASPSSVLTGAACVDSINANTIDGAAAHLADDAVLALPFRGEEYVGKQAIDQYLRATEPASRTYDIVKLNSNGDTIHAVVDVCDYGVRWGRMSVDAVVDGQTLRSLTITRMRLLL